MDWFKELYDDFRAKHGFGAVPESRTAREVDFMVAELGIRKGSKVLDLFCGTGRHCIELARRGIDAVGIEWNLSYIAIAAERCRQASVSPTFIQGDVRGTDFGDGYDAVIIMYQSFGYLSDAEDREVLRRSHAALKPGGRFLIEILNRDSILRNWQPSSQKEMDGVTVVEEREFDVLSSRINSKVTRYEGGGRVEKKVSWRMYSAHEIRNVCEEVGFAFVAGYASIDRAPLTVDARMMRLVFEKPAG